MVNSFLGNRLQFILTSKSGANAAALFVLSYGIHSLTDHNSCDGFRDILKSCALLKWLIKLGLLKMKTDDVVRLEAISKIIAVLAWPAFFLFLILYLGPVLKYMIINSEEVSFKGAGFEASIKKRKEEAASALFAASVTRDTDRHDVVSVESKEKLARAAVVSTINAYSLERLRGAKILWVDDKPEGNYYERRAFEVLGVSFDTAKDSEEALKKIKSGSFDAVISDMGRPSDEQAGYTLLGLLKGEGYKLPFIIYSSQNSSSLKNEAKDKGAFGSTNLPSELFVYVVSALGFPKVY